MRRWGWAVGAWALAGCGTSSSTAPSASLPALEVALPSLESGRVPDESVYGGGSGCAGKDVSIAVQWKGAPAATKSFVVVLHDPDAPRAGGWYHWAVFDLPASTSELAKGASAGGLPAGAKQGKNDFGDARYGGPCPPPGKAHRYVAHVFAEGVESLGLEPGASAKDVEAKAREHALAAGDAMGTYGR